MSVTPEVLLRNIKIAIVFSSSSESLKYEFQSLYLHFLLLIIYLIIFHPAPSVIFIKWNISFVTEVLEQPGSEACEHKIVAILEWL